MEAILMQLVSGAVGGNVAGMVMKSKSLGLLWNSVAGLLGGGIGGQILASVTGGGGGMIGDLGGSAVGGALVMAVIGMLKKAKTDQ